MKVFLTGGTGWIGSAILLDLLAAGHRVSALARTSENESELRTMGAEPIIGSLSDPEKIAAAAASADGVIHTAIGSALNDGQAIREDVAAIESIGQAYKGSSRPIVVTHGLGPLTSGRTYLETDRPDIVPAYPRASEQTAFALASRGIAASVVRPARSVHGLGERHGFVPMLAAVARKTGVSAFVDDGNALWPACHRLDVARVYRLAVERGAIGEAYHAVAEGVPFRAVAEAIGRQLGVPAVSIDPEEAADHFGKLAMWVSGRDPVSTELTRKWLGWALSAAGGTIKKLFAVTHDASKEGQRQLALFSHVRRHERMSVIWKL